MLMRSEVSIVQKWCELFPAQIFLTHPNLCIIQARILILSYKEENRNRIEDFLHEAEQVALSLEDKQRCRSLTAQAAGVRAFLGLIPASAVDLNRESSLAQRALDLLSSDDPLRSTTLLTIGYIHMASQNLPAARKTMEEVRRSSLKQGNYYGVIEANFELACFALYQGKLNRAKEICREGQATIIALTANSEQELPAVGCLDIVLGCIFLEENQLAEAEQSLLHGLDLIGWTINPYYRLTAYIALFQLREAQGKAEEAIHLLNDLEEDWPDIAFCTQGLKVMHLMRTAPNDPDTLVRAEKWCQAFSCANGENMSLPGMGPIGAAQTYYLASLIWVQARILLGKPEETLLYLERQQKLAEAQGLVHRLIELYLAESLARRTLKEDKRSYEMLGHALAQAKAAGYLRIFNLGPEFVPSLKEAVIRGIVPSYTELILKTIGSVPGFDSGQLQTSGLLNMNVKGIGSHDDQLTERELEVLRLMASGTSTQEIANQFVVTTGTVKSHVNHILSKLDVHSRLEAVARARELGVLKI
jgi:LuxR family maltose regulon positive regulatory protein